MGKILFWVGSKNYTPYINERNYSMRRVELFQEWRDGNFNVHRVHERWQVKGSFTLSFFTEQDYDFFLNDIELAKNADGWCSVTVFIEDDKSVKGIKAFVDYKTRISWTNGADMMSTETKPAVAEVEVTITER